jgi:hypothetical protein
MIDGDKFSDAVVLLADENLVWSNDFEQIRKPLRELLFGVLLLGSATAASLPDLIRTAQKHTNELTAAITKDHEC